LVVFRKYVEKIQVSFKLDKITGYLGEGQYAFLITSRSVLPRIRNDSEKYCTENENTQFIHKIQYKLYELRFPFLENRTVCEIMWKKCCGVGQVAVDNLEHAHCMLDK